MNNLSNNELLEHIDSKYSLVTVVSKRARQILDGSRPLIDADDDEGAISIAVKELKSDLLSFHKIERQESSEKESEELEAEQAGIEVKEEV